ncbi:hypothetical protein D9619_008706 [Psilocybe cf. subviscida]|uniref:HNH nuclease domain-containing protein n=1 Tax=Psilocybe cf. subviscida TaxID=2480587 RepID=A0A8H5F0Y3_9AGAR|nr:hypothetical protein D9619_008706 [Psilocybe cf. subviscida]
MPRYSSQSITSSTTSLSSDASVKIYEERLKPRIETKMNSGATLQGLVDTADKIVTEVFALDPRSTFTYKKKDEETSVQLDKVMTAMLAFAEECGGQSGKRYVASAICCCSEDEDVVGALAALGTTWLTHFLFVFRASRGHPNQLNQTPSEVETPTVDQSAIGNRKISFADDVIKRDGYACILTRSQDLAHPNPVEEIFTTSLVAAHILPSLWAVGQFDEDHNSYKSALTTFDILVNYTHLPVQTLEQLRDKLDHPSNGMTLQLDARGAFDRFDWCLKKTEIENAYDLKVFRDRGIMKKPNRITFEDRSNDFSDSTRNLKRNAPVDLPNPHYIEIHAAIAGILHMSGTGKFFDELLNNNKEDRDKVSPVRCWTELEKLMEERLLRDSIIESFQLATVY